MTIENIVGLFEILIIVIGGIVTFVKVQSMTVETKIRLEELEIKVDKLEVLYQSHDKIIAVQDRDLKYIRETIEKIDLMLSKSLGRQ